MKATAKKLTTFLFTSSVCLTGAFAPMRTDFGYLAVVAPSQIGGTKTLKSGKSYGTVASSPSRLNLFGSNDESSEDKSGSSSPSKMDSSEFWKMQKELAASMTESADKSLKQEQITIYQKKANALVSETFYFSILIFSFLWFISPNPFSAISYLFGALLGTAYSYGLGKYVQTLGGSAMEAEEVQGAGVGSARFAFLIALFIVVGKFRSQGLQELPSIFGFFTYQLASLSQGLKDTDE